MNKKAIFMGGIHGVGKTTLCELILKQTGIKFYTASSLIKRVRAELVESGVKKVADINNNQQVLLSGIEMYVESGPYYVLDGHFCLLNSSGEVTRIPPETFSAISPSAIVCVSDRVDVIRSRISGRDDVDYDEGLLSEFLSEESKYASELASSLRVPFLHFDNRESVNGLLQFIESVTGSVEK